MKIISSYPRSGSAKLKFLLCNIFYPLIDHDFNTINHYIPSIDSAMQLNNCALNPKFLCTHANIRADIYLYRHVGDVLISEYWYKQKYYGTDLTLDQFIEETNYGEQWRRSIENGRGAEKRIAFEQLDDVGTLSNILECRTAVIETALKKCTFDTMAQKEKQSNLGGNSIPYMRSGKSHQWLILECKMDLLRANEGELAYLGYWFEDDWEGLTKQNYVN